MKTNLLRLFMPMVLVFTLISCSNDSTEDLAPESNLVTNYASTTDEVELAYELGQVELHTDIHINVTTWYNEKHERLPKAQKT